MTSQSLQRNVLIVERETSPLQTELRQRRPFPSPQAEALVGLLRTADLVRREATALFDAHGLTLQQYNVLRILRGAGPEGLPTLEIAARMIEVAPGITRLLDRLERKDLVQRLRCPKDRRQVLCSITPAGLALLARLDEPVASSDARLLGGLTPERLAQLIALLDDLRAHVLARTDPPAPREESRSFILTGEKKP